MILHAVESGAGPTLVLLHGLFGSARNFGTVQKRLSASFRVLALDLRNHGDSPHAPGMGYPVQAQDVLATLRAHGALPCALLGHSMGGKVAMRLALDEPEAVQRLIVADIAPAPYPPHHHGEIAALAALALAPGMTRAEADAALAGAIPNAAVRGFLLQNLRTGPVPSWRLGLREIDAGMADIEAWPEPPAAAYAGPTLFLRGERSDYVREAHRPAIKALFPAARVVTLKGAGHWLHADDFAGFMAAVEAFLQA